MLENLLLRLDGDDIQLFAELYCSWYDSDYYDDCYKNRGDWIHPDSRSIVDDATNTIRDWADNAGNLELLNQYVRSLSK